MTNKWLYSLKYTRLYIPTKTDYKVVGIFYLELQFYNIIAPDFVINYFSKNWKMNKYLFTDFLNINLTAINILSYSSINWTDEDINIVIRFYALIFIYLLSQTKKNILE